MQTLTKVQVVRDVNLAIEAREVGRKNRKTFTILSGTGCLEETIWVGDKKFVPFEDDDSPIPKEAWDRVNLLREADIPIIDFIVMHEDEIAKEAIKEQTSWEPQKKQLKEALTALGNVVVGAVGVFAYTGLAIAPLLLIDPGLVCVLGDERKTWLCVCTWHEGFEG